MSSPARQPRVVAIRNAHPHLRFARPAVTAALAILDQHAARFRGGCPPGELSLAFLTDRSLAKIHADFMNDPTPTDVITFEGDAAAGLAGEICVSADTAARFIRLKFKGPQTSRRRAKPTAEPSPFSEELMLYVVHGWLHLAGYDDLEPAKKRRMRAAEARAMKLLRTAQAVPAFKFIR
jgi:probable rRNA maturation factor